MYNYTVQYKYFVKNMLDYIYRKIYTFSDFFKFKMACILCMDYILSSVFQVMLTHCSLQTSIAHIRERFSTSQLLHGHPLANCAGSVSRCVFLSVLGIVLVFLYSCFCATKLLWGFGWPLHSLYTLAGPIQLLTCLVNRITSLVYYPD